MSIRYISIHEISRFHEVDIRILEELAGSGLVETLWKEEEWCIREQDLEPLELMIRLHRDLGVNPAGIETIFYMRQRLQAMRRRMETLEARLRRYEQLLGDGHDLTPGDS